MKKYCLTDETMKNDSGATLHRIQALIDIPRAFVKAGDQGGWIEKKKNLSHKGRCWVGDEAKVHGNAKVYDDYTCS